MLEQINSPYQNCMDGRQALAHATVKENGKVELLEVGPEAKKVVAPALPGAGLGPVAYLEQKLQISRMQAIVTAEKAFAALDMMPTFHIDNHHGEVEITVPGTDEVKEEQLIHLIQETLKGCGFAALMWQGEGEADALLTLLRDRGWVVQVLVGIHPEKDAQRVLKPGHAVHHPTAHKIGQETFSMNDHETEALYGVIHGVLLHARLISNPRSTDRFVRDAMDWTHEQFSDIAWKLRKIPSVGKLK